MTPNNLHHERENHQQKDEKGHQDEEPGDPCVSRVANEVEDPCPDGNDDNLAEKKEGSVGD